MVIANFFRGGGGYTQRGINSGIYLGYIYTQNSDFHSEFTSYKSKFEFVSRNSYFFSKFSEVYISKIISHHKIQNKFGNCDFFSHISDFFTTIENFKLVYRTIVVMNILHKMLTRNTYRKCLNC